MEVKKIITRNFDRSKDLLEKNGSALKAIAEALLDKEILSSEEIEDIINGNKKGAKKKPEKKRVSKKEKAKGDPAEV